MDLKAKVKAGVAKQIREKKKQQAEEFNQIYNKSKEYQFKEWDNINMDKFVILPKRILNIGLNKASLAVYPVLCSNANFEHDIWFKVSLKTIGKQAGISIPTVQKGLEELCRRKIVNMKQSTGTRRVYEYKVNFIRRDLIDSNPDNCIYFYTALIESGIWARLKPRSKALYLSMRSLADIDIDLYSLVSGQDYELHEFDQYLKNRLWDPVSKSISNLCKRAGISTTNYQSIFDQLEDYRLIERVENFFKVWIRPKRIA